MGHITYTEEQKKQAAIAYAVYGNYQKVADKLNIPMTTVHTWSKEWDGWDALLVEVRSEKAAEHRQAYSRLIDKALAKAEKGLDELDGKLTASDIKTLVISAATSTDKVRLADNMPTRIQGSQDSLEALAAQFKRLADDKVLVPRNNVINQEDTE